MQVQNYSFLSASNDFNLQLSYFSPTCFFVQRTFTRHLYEYECTQLKPVKKLLAKMGHAEHPKNIFLFLPTVQYIAVKKCLVTEVIYLLSTTHTMTHCQVCTICRVLIRDKVVQTVEILMKLKTCPD